MPLELKKRPTTKVTANTDAPKVSKKQHAAMNKPFVATLPEVDLLSAEVREVIEQRRLKRLFIGLGVGVLLGTSAVWFGQGHMISVAQHKLDDAQATSVRLNAQQAALAPVKTFYAQIETNKATIQTTMAKEVLTSQVLNALASTTPPGMSFQSTNVSLTSGAATSSTGVTDPTATTSSCPSQDPYTASGVSAGCVTVSGTASSRTVLGGWLDNLSRSSTFTVAFIPTTSVGGDGGGISFSATIGLSDSVYKNRYADPNFLKAGTN